MLKMSLNELRISADAYLVCLTHVLSTESTEVMGVLLGDVEDGGVCRVLSAKALVRLDKRKDRVEISSNQLMSGATEAERLAIELRRTVRVVGWYHSHPHITVWPSVVDIGTQNSYQLMDSCFAGLIFAVFPKRQSAGVQAACFQSVRDVTGSLKRRDVPVRIEPTRTIAPHCLQALVGLPEALREEEMTSYDAVQPASSNDQLTEMHNQAVLVSNITQQLGVLTMPLLQLLENRLQRNQRQLRRLLAERDSLTERLGGHVTVKSEPADAAAARSDSGSDTDHWPSDGDGRSSPRQPDGDAGSSEDTVFLPSAAELELGVSPSRRRREGEADSDSAASVELSEPRRHPRVKRERGESDADGSERSEPRQSRPRRQLTVVKEEPDSTHSQVSCGASRPRRTAVKRERRGSTSSDAGRPRAAPVVKQEPDCYLDMDGSKGRTPSRESDSASVSGKRARLNVKREPASHAEQGDKKRTSKRDDLK